jgi:hypothetical protein
MDGQEKLLDYETIKAAVAGEKWATEKVLAHYHLHIENHKLCLWKKRAVALKR